MLFRSPAFILPEVKDESKWFKGKHRFVDPETRHSFVFQGHRGLYVSYNTAQVKADEIKSWTDLVQPKWKGKLGIEADDYDWFGSVSHIVGEEKARATFSAIGVANGFSLRKGHTLITNLVAAGDVPLGLTVYLQNIETSVYFLIVDMLADRCSNRINVKIKRKYNFMT